MCAAERFITPPPDLFVFHTFLFPVTKQTHRGPTNVSGKLSSTPTTAFRDFVKAIFIFQTVNSKFPFRHKHSYFKSTSPIQKRKQNNNVTVDSSRNPNEPSLFSSFDKFQFLSCRHHFTLKCTLSAQVTPVRP